MKIKHKYYLILFVCMLFILLPDAGFIIATVSRSVMASRAFSISIALLIFDMIGLAIIYYFLLRPVSRLNETVSMILDSPDMRDVAVGSDSLLDRFQTLMDREYNSNVAFRQAALDALQSQINPHFLYNALECIRGQAIVEGADTIADMAKALSEFFRYSMNLNDKLVWFTDELHNVDAYVKIQNYRFSNKYHLRIHMSDEDQAIIEKCKLPRLTLQPIVENSLLHGVRDSERDSETIDVAAELTTSRLIIRITDYGKGMSQDKLDSINAVLCKKSSPSAYQKSEHRRGIALHNINERIQLLFGDEYGLHAFSTPSMGCTIEIVLPICRD